MTKTVNTYFKLSHPRRVWEMPDHFATLESANNEILKIQVRQKEKGYIPDKFIIIRVETETFLDDNGDFIKSEKTETRV